MIPFAVQGLPLWRANSTALHIAVGNRDLQAVGLLLREYVSFLRCTLPESHSMLPCIMAQHGCVCVYSTATATLLCSRQLAPCVA